MLLPEILDLHILHMETLGKVGLPALRYDSLSTSLVSLFPLCAAIVSVAVFDTGAVSGLCCSSFEVCHLLGEVPTLLSANYCILERD